MIDKIHCVFIYLIFNAKILVFIVLIPFVWNLYSKDFPKKNHLAFYVPYMSLLHFPKKTIHILLYRTATPDWPRCACLSARWSCRSCGRSSSRNGRSRRRRLLRQTATLLHRGSSSSSSKVRWRETMRSTGCFRAMVRVRFWLGIHVWFLKMFKR